MVETYISNIGEKKYVLIDKIFNDLEYDDYIFSFYEDKNIKTIDIICHDRKTGKKYIKNIKFINSIEFINETPELVYSIIKQSLMNNEIKIEDYIYSNIPSYKKTKGETYDYIDIQITFNCNFGYVYIKSIHLFSLVNCINNIIQ